MLSYEMTAREAVDGLVNSLKQQSLYNDFEEEIRTGSVK
jgi:hypothetical protein